MAFQAKITVTRGKPNLKDMSVVSGTTIAGSDAIEINIDATKMTKGEAMQLLDEAKQKLFASKWPLL